MRARITPRLIELTYEAALKSFWRKRALHKFLRGSHVADNFLSTWSETESKREFLDRLFDKLQASNKGKAVILKMAKNLSEQTTFPDLRNWEDSGEKISGAQRAVEELKRYLKDAEQEQKSEEERRAARERAHEERTRIRRALTDKSKLQSRLDELHPKVGTQDGGYEFESWFYDILDFCEITNRRPYISNGRQIDGSLTLEGTTYLVELKFAACQSGVVDVDSLKAKIEDKADNTMGILVAISGFSSVAINQASGRRTTTLLIDSSHLYMFLSGVKEFDEIVLRIRRNAAQTGEAYLPVSRFGG